MLESFGSLPYGNVAPAPVITSPASFALATIALAHPSMESKEMKYPPRGAIQEPISKSAKLCFQSIKYSVELRTHDVCVFLHMLNHAVDISKESCVAQLI